MPTWNPPSAPPPASVENYSETTNWTGGTPTATTDAIFDGSVSNRNCVINLSNLTCLNLTIQNGYSGTITFTNALEVRGNVTFITSVNFAGTAGIKLFTTAISPATATLTSNGKAFNQPIVQTSGGSRTYTVVGIWQVTDFITQNINGNPLIFNGSEIRVSGNLTINSVGGSGTTQFVLNGSGTFSTLSGKTWGHSTEINTTGNIIVGLLTLVGSGTFKYTTSGTITFNNDLTISGNWSLDLPNRVLQNFIQTGNTTCTLLSDIDCANVTLGTIAGGTALTLNGPGLRLKTRGNLTMGGAVISQAGTATVSMTGTGNISFSSTSFNINLEINSPSGTIGLITNLTLGGVSKSFIRTLGAFNSNLNTVTISSLNQTYTLSNNLQFYNLTVGQLTTINII